MIERRHLALCTIVACFASAVAIPAQTPELVRDLNTRPVLTASSDPEGFLSFGSNVYYLATVSTTSGASLYRSDVSTGRTAILSSTFRNVRNLTRSGNRLYFFAENALGTRHYLCSSDGLRSAATVVSSFAGSFPPPLHLTAVGSRIYFTFAPGTTGYELWTSDGTTAGTRPLRDIRPGRDGSDPRDLVAAGGKLYFSADDGVVGRELWRSDGTPSGTTLFLDLEPGSGSSNPTHLTRDKDSSASPRTRLYFAAHRSGLGRELWMANGNPSETRLVADIAGGGTGSNPLDLADDPASSTFYFTAWTPATGRELCVTDGTTVGTRIVDIWSGVGSSNPAELVANQGKVFFSAYDTAAGTELWESDGTPAGTARIDDIRSGSLGSDPADIVVLGQPGARRLFVAANDGQYGRSRLWHFYERSFGWVGIQLGRVGFEPAGITPISTSGVVFAATDSEHGREPWIADSSSASLLLDLNSRNSDSRTRGAALRNGVSLFGTLLFSATDFGLTGQELYRSDGTESGTRRVRDILPGPDGSNPDRLTVAGSRAFFTANSDGVGRRLWRTDGTSQGTVLVSSAVTNPIAMTAVGEDIYFIDGRDVWRSDGTPAGTQVAFQMVAREMIEFRGRLYFVATDPNHGTELYRVDGARAVLVADIFPGPGSSAPSGLTIVGDRLYFAADDSIHGLELWKTDGTLAGTVLVRDIARRSFSSSPRDLVAAGETLFFSATDGVGTSGLWKSDGTGAGTVHVHAVASMAPRMGCGELLYFVARTAAGRELWRSDGTNSGTFQLRDINPGPPDARAMSLTPSGDRYLWFRALGTDGYELWRTDGSTAGTVQVTDIVPGSGSSQPEPFGVVDSSSGAHLVFAATDPIKGYELFRIAPGATTQSVGQPCAAGDSGPRLSVSDPILGTVFTVRGRHARAGSFAFTLFSLKPQQPASLGNGCVLYCDLASFAFLGPQAPVAGAWDVALPMPNDPVMLDLTIAYQGVLAPSPASIGFDLTNGVLATAGN